jgi:HD superfamily phosphohydrolase
VPKTKTEREGNTRHRSGPVKETQGVKKKVGNKQTNKKQQQKKKKKQPKERWRDEKEEAAVESAQRKGR